MNNNTIRGVKQANQNYTYFAFISYKSEDEKYARRLKRELQAYRIPAKTHKKHRDLPLRCSPVFLDKTNLKPGALNEGLRSEVQSSKYLIIICSKNAHDQSTYLDHELQYFLDSSGDRSRVIPFIVEESKHVVEECFPKQLAELCEEENIVGVNIHDDGWRTALLKVVAAMLGIRREELESDDARRRKRQRIAAFIMAVILLAGGIWTWDYFRTKTEYYLDYTEVYGEPRGIIKLSNNDIKSMRAHYKFIISKRKVREVRHEDSIGNLVSHTLSVFDSVTNCDSEYINRPSLAKYFYIDGSISRVELYDHDEHKIALLQYDNINMVTPMSYNDGTLRTYEIIKGRTQRKITRQNKTEFPIYSECATVMSHIEDNIQYKLKYDENGYLVSVTFLQIPFPYVDKDGIGELQYKRDLSGRIVQIDYFYGYSILQSSSILEYKEGLIKNKDIRIKHLQDVWHKIYEYNPEGDLITISFINGENLPLSSAYSYSSVKNTYDVHHNLISQKYYNSKDEHTENNVGISNVEAKYDAQGHVAYEIYYDLKGKCLYEVDHSLSDDQLAQDEIYSFYNSLYTEIYNEVNMDN